MTMTMTPVMTTTKTTKKKKKRKAVAARQAGQQGLPTKDDIELARARIRMGLMPSFCVVQQVRSVREMLAWRIATAVYADHGRGLFALPRRANSSEGEMQVLQRRPRSPFPFSRHGEQQWRAITRRVFNDRPVLPAGFADLVRDEVSAIINLKHQRVLQQQRVERKRGVPVPGYGPAAKLGFSAQTGGRFMMGDRTPQEQRAVDRALRVLRHGVRRLLVPVMAAEEGHGAQLGLFIQQDEAPTHGFQPAMAGDAVPICERRLASGRMLRLFRCRVVGIEGQSKEVSGGRFVLQVRRGLNYVVDERTAYDVMTTSGLPEEARWRAFTVLATDKPLDPTPPLGDYSTKTAFAQADPAKNADRGYYYEDLAVSLPAGRSGRSD